MEAEHPWIRDAYRLAQYRHRGLKHPLSQKPWFEFIINVYFQIYKLSKDHHLRTAALLFDGFRNKLMTYKEIARRFDSQVAEIIREISFEENADQTEEQIRALYQSKIKRMSKEGVMLLLAERLELIRMLEPRQRQQSSSIIDDVFILMDSIPKPLYTEYSLLIETILSAIQEFNNQPDDSPAQD